MSFPDRHAIMDFIRQSTAAVGKRDIIRAFHLQGADRQALKQLLREMEDEGLLETSGGRKLHVGGSLPPVAVLLVVAVERGRVIAVPEKWDENQNGEQPPRVRIATKAGRSGRAEKYEVGDRLLTRISGGPASCSGTVIKKLRRARTHVTGVVQAVEGGGYLLKPIDRRERRHWPLHHSEEVVPGQLVRAELKGTGQRTVAYVDERLGDTASPAFRLSDIALAAKGIEAEFPAGAEDEAQRSAGRTLGPREDWTAIPFVTIDPPDARDHDDAVWAEADGDGWRLLVAIADVSWYVRPATTLDRAAFDRGNSIYFPDRVVPMLPEALSADACSLKAGAERAVLAAELRLSADGELLGQSFRRARIRVIENLAYETVQAVMDGKQSHHLKAPVFEPLWNCWRALMRARAKRDPLDLELPERRVVLDAHGGIAGVVLRERLDAHRVIEEMMIAANVAAARALEARKAPVMYRNHGVADREKLLSLKEYLSTAGLSLALGQVIRTSTFNRILKQAEGRADYVEIAEAILRAQTQAYYGPNNEGHFGLSLASYAHFTSPIRRYDDILVHRALVSAYGLGEGGLPDHAEQRFAAIGEHLSFTERRAMEAERDTLDRYIARHLAAHIGEIVRVRISGVQAFGFFASVVDTGGDGLVPVSALGDERFRFDEAGRFLEGVETRTRYSFGQQLDARIEEADPVSGALRFSIPGVEPVSEPQRFRRGRPAGRGRPRLPPKKR